MALTSHKADQPQNDTSVGIEEEPTEESTEEPKAATK